MIFSVLHQVLRVKKAYSRSFTVCFNPFLANVRILYPVKTPENQTYSGVFRECEKCEHGPEIGQPFKCQPTK